jgi:hypothetical protein
VFSLVKEGELPYGTYLQFKNEGFVGDGGVARFCAPMVDEKFMKLQNLTVYGNIDYDLYDGCEGVILYVEFIDDPGFARIC